MAEKFDINEKKKKVRTEIKSLADEINRGQQMNQQRLQRLKQLEGKMEAFDEISFEFENKEKVENTAPKKPVDKKED